MAKIYPELLFDSGRALTPDTPKRRLVTLSDALRLQRGRWTRRWRTAPVSGTIRFFQRSPGRRSGGGSGPSLEVESL
jgi:hypothetical protein